jgi:hypothetical protein
MRLRIEATFRRTNAAMQCSGASGPGRVDGITHCRGWDPVRVLHDSVVAHRTLEQRAGPARTAEEEIAQLSARRGTG